MVEKNETMEDKMEQIITDEIQKKDEETVFQGLLSYNLEKLDDKNPRDVGIYYKDNGTIVAGLIGQTHGNWLTVKYLWVTESLRGQHIGTNLLEQAERIAKERGCHYSFLDSFSFQAPQFYKKQGYREVFTLEEYPVSGKRHYFTKTLFHEYQELTGRPGVMDAFGSKEKRKQ